MDQSVVIDIADASGERLAVLVEPLTMQWMPLEGHSKPQWVLWAWWPDIGLMTLSMAAIRSWTPVMGDDEDGRGDEGADADDNRGRTCEGNATSHADENSGQRRPGGPNVAT